MGTDVLQQYLQPSSSSKTDVGTDVPSTLLM